MPRWTHLASVTAAVVLSTGGIVYNVAIQRPHVEFKIVQICSELVWVLVGVAAWHRRPDSWVGLLVALLGLVALSGEVWFMDNGYLLVWSFLNGYLSLLLFAWALLTFPDGRTETAAERLFLKVAAGASVIWIVHVTISAPNWFTWCAQIRCPANPFLVHESLSMSWVTWWAQRVALLICGLWFAVLMILRVRRLPPVRRRTVKPVLWAVALPLPAYVARVIMDSWPPPPGLHWYILAWWESIGPAAVPVVMAVSLVMSSLARTAVADLVIELKRTRTDELEAVLRGLLHDSSVQIAVALDGGYTDLSGRPLVLPLGAAAGRRAVTPIRDGSLLLHDPLTKTDNRPLFEAAVAAIGLALENADLTARVRAQLAEVTASRERILQAGDEARQRLERDLHDGAQQRLLALGMSLQQTRETLDADAPQAKMLDQATDDLRATLAELRHLARGLQPAMLAERGLEAALRELIRHLPLDVLLDVEVPLRPSETCEKAAYFVAAEALQNVSKYAPAATVYIVVRSQGRSLTIDVCDDGPGGAQPDAGTGLRGLVDRVAASGGVLHIDSPPGSGTRLRAELPIGLPA